MKKAMLKENTKRKESILTSLKLKRLTEPFTPKRTSPLRISKK